MVELFAIGGRSVGRFLHGQVLGKRSVASDRKPSPRRRPILESLEGRRLLSAGDLDLSFHGNGTQIVAFDRSGGVSDQAYAVAVQADGKIVVVGRAEFS